jgi:histone H3/H4
MHDNLMVANPVYMVLDDHYKVHMNKIMETAMRIAVRDGVRTIMKRHVERALKAEGETLF